MIGYFAQCPLYGKAKEPKKSDDKSKAAAEEKEEEESKQEKQNDLMQDGLVFKQCVRDKIVDRRAHNQVQYNHTTMMHNLLMGASELQLVHTICNIYN